MQQDNYHLLLKKLNEFIRKYYLNKLIRGSLFFISLALLLFLSVTVLEYFGNFNSQVRTVLFYTSVVSLVLVFAWFILYPLSKILAIGKRISNERAAQIIGKHFGEVDDKLYNVLQLKKQSEQETSDLILASINQKIHELNPVPFQLAVNLGENKKYLKYAVPPLVVVAIIAFFSPQIISDSTSRLVAHNVEFEALAPYQIEIKNQSLESFRNEDFNLQVKLIGDEIPNQLKVNFNDQSYLMKKSGARNFQYTFKNLQEDLSFFLSDGEFDSKFYEVKTLPKPALVDFSVELNYPAYLGRKNVVKSNVGDITIPEGTEVKWTFKTSDTENLSVLNGDSSALANQSGEDEYIFKSRYFESTIYGLIANNQFVSQPDTVFYNLEVIPDLRPSIEVDTKVDSLNPSMRYFQGFVKDDYGFSRLEFHFQFKGENDSNGMPKSVTIPINKNLPQTDFYHSWNISSFNLKVGESLDYYFQVWDNDGINGAKSARTQTFSYKAPSKEELQQKEDKSNHAIKEEIKQNIKLSQDIKKDLEELKEKMLNKKSLGFQEKKKLEELLKKQKQLKQNMKKLSDENKQKNNFQNEFEKPSEELVEKQKQLEELFEKVMSDEMKQMMEEMEKMMKELNKDKLQESLDKMELSNEEVEKELDRNLELFKQLEFEKQLNDAKEKLDQLKEEQSELKKETEEKDSRSEDLKKEQDKLNKEFDKLSEKLDELEKKNQELETPNKMEDTKSLEEQIKEDMKESLESLDQNKKNDASGEQQEAEEGMEELSQKLSDMQMQMQSGAQAENLEDMRSLLENLIELSFDQEDVMNQLKGLDRNDPKYVELAQEQNKLQDDSKVIEDSLFALSKRVLQLAPIVNREMSAVKDNMKKAVEQLGERNTPMATSRQQLAMTSINNLALLFDEAIQQMQKQMQSQMQSKGQCKKPGSKPGGKPSISGMKKMQQQLKKQMESLKKAMEEGKMPNGKQGKGQKPGDGKGGKGGMSKELAQMAAKQAAIRKAIEEMQEQIGESNGNGGGNLKKIGDLMEENETDLVNKQITNETILRQQEILTRLLQSEKAEREREKEERREAIEFTDEISRNPDSFFEYNRRKEKEIELLKTLPPSFNNFYKTKVTEYFNQIEP